jgi:D-alanyl-D-alanine carboxypeptidase
MRQPPSYESIVRTHQLNVLAPGSDIAVKDGDLVLNRRGDISWADPKFDALFHFVRAYQMNEPTLALLFDQSVATVSAEAALVEEINNAAERAARDQLAGLPGSYEDMLG